MTNDYYMPYCGQCRKPVAEKDREAIKSGKIKPPKKGRRIKSICDVCLAREEE